jgi:DNA-binding GntR family transcriptional regulator
MSDVKSLHAGARQRRAWRHETLAADLRRRLAAREIMVGDGLPTERAMAEEYGVSRATVREALRALEAQGMIRRRQGSGTVVTAEAPQRFLQSIESLETLLSYPLNTVVRLDGVTPAGADDDLVASRDQGDVRDWSRIALRRYVSGSDLPISLSHVFVPTVFAAAADRVGATDKPVYRLIEERFGVFAADIALRIDAVAVRPDLAGLLAVRAGAPATRIVRAYRDAGGALFEVSVTTHPAGRYAFEAKLSRR